MSAIQIFASNSGEKIGHLCDDKPKNSKTVGKVNLADGWKINVIIFFTNKTLCPK